MTDHPTDLSQGNRDASQRLRTATEEALAAFWQVVVAHYPEAQTGDLSPLTCFRFDQAAEDAIEEWVWANAPSTTDE
jgi:hypothetical protein